MSIIIVFNFSWELKWPQEKLKNAYAKFWGDKERALWYVMVFSGVANYFSSGINVVKVEDTLK